MLQNRAFLSDIYKTVGTKTCQPLRTAQNISLNSLDDFISEIMLFTEIWKQRGPELTLPRVEMVYARIAQKECRGLWIACGFSKSDVWTVSGCISFDYNSSTCKKLQHISFKSCSLILWDAMIFRQISKYLFTTCYIPGMACIW